MLSADNDIPPRRGRRPNRSDPPVGSLNVGVVGDGRYSSACRRSGGLDRPHQAEGLAGRIGVDAPVRAGTVQPGGADVKGGPFRRVHVLDRHVEVDLLRERRPATGNRR